MDERFIPPVTTAPQPRLWHRVFSHRVLVAIIVAIIAATSIYLWVLFHSAKQPITFDFQVKQGDTINTIAERLRDDGIISHRIFFYFTYYIFGNHTSIQAAGYKLSNTMSLRDIVYTLEAKPATKFVDLPKNLSKDKIGAILADALGWPAIDRQYFSHTYAGMQWQHYQEYIKDYFQDKNSWDERKTHTFLTLSALYYDDSYDFLKNFYIPGRYEIPLDASRAQVAGILIDRFVAENPDDNVALQRFVDSTSADTIAKLIDEQMILMPDIVSVPPQDLTLKTIDGETFLLFTATYWNKGRGPLDLVADPKTKGLTGDHERNVYQRIYSLDGDYTERLSGKFLWHAPHLHYHYQDFAVYTLEPKDKSLTAPLQSQKSTYCVRDTEPIDLAHPGAQKTPSYTTCGKERQGLSPGWADSYYYTYVDQRFNVTNLPAGEYTLRVGINPLDRFDEITKDNNVGEVVFNLDVQNNKIKVLSERTHGYND